MASDPTQEGASEETETINVVPLADLTLVLLIILMVLSPMITQSMIHVATPQLKAEKEDKPEEPSDQKPLEPLMISILGTGYTLNNAPTANLEELMAALQARILESPDRPVLVTAENQISVGKVVQVLDLARQNGAERVSLLKKTESPQEAVQ
jgi:biopolymer transport protein ExbD